MATPFVACKSCYMQLNSQAKSFPVPDHPSSAVQQVEGRDNYRANIWKCTVLNPPDIICMRKRLPHHPETTSCQRTCSSSTLGVQTKQTLLLIPAQAKYVYMALGRLL